MALRTAELEDRTAGETLLARSEALILVGMEEGRLHPDAVLVAFPELDPAQAEPVFEILRAMGIAIGEDEDETVDMFLVEEVEENSTALADPVRMYFTEIGKVSLLTAADDLRRSSWALLDRNPNAFRELGQLDPENVARWREHLGAVQDIAQRLRRAG